MKDICRLIGWMVVDLFRSRATLEAEIWALRQQINVLRRTAPTKHAFSAIDRSAHPGVGTQAWDLVEKRILDMLELTR